ncbi:MAG: hypothetical protein ACE5HI_09445 [bacterium]
MSNFYEDILLREEYNLVVKLQRDREFAKYVDVKYEDRISGEERNVLMNPSANKYPEKYIVDYRMPVFVNDGQLRRDWHGTATITLSETVLSNRHADHGPHVEFTSNFDPFNNHVRQYTICSGNAWVVAKDNGLWHFIISLGALINQDEFVCAEGSHFNDRAYNHWVNRRRKPVTNIKWPLDLLDQGNLIIEPKKPEPKPKKKINIVKKAPESIEPPKKKIIRIVSKTDSPTTKKIKVIKKNSDE